MKVLVALCFVIFALAAVIAQKPQDKLYNGSFDFFEWNDANRVGNWTFEENWLQLEEPCLVAFVSISGDNTIHVDKDRTINELLLGSNRWEDTRLVVDQDLTIYYDDVPQIQAVRGYRMTNGQIQLTIEGKGFGFEYQTVSVTAYNYFDDDGNVEVEDNLHSIVQQSPSGPNYHAYACNDGRLAYRDEKYVCNIAVPEIYPETFYVVLTANGQQAQAALISKFIK